MISVRTLEHSTPFFPIDIAELKGYLALCSKDLPWLGELDDRVTFHWCDCLLLDGVIGAFSPFFPDRIFLMRGDLKLLVSTAVHELTHRKQYKELGWRYSLCSVPLLRNILLEKEAKANELLVDAILRTNLEKI